MIFEGDGTLGYLPIVRATEIAIAKAKQSWHRPGPGRYIGHYGSAGHYARMCMVWLRRVFGAGLAQPGPAEGRWRIGGP